MFAPSTWLHPQSIQERTTPVQANNPTTTSSSPPLLRPEPTPPSIPRTFYRVDYPGSQTTYSPHDGFRARNQSTLINTPSQIQRFALPHLKWQTNFSSPFISVFADKSHAEAWARRLFARNPEALYYIVAIDTERLARGPVFRAKDVLDGNEGLREEERWAHYSEYLVLHRIPGQAVIDEDVVSAMGTWRDLGLQ